MGIREQLNQKPQIVTGATIGVIVLAFVFIIVEIRSSGPGHFSPPTERYYTDDDGASYFTDTVDKIPPFDHGGKQAVVAFVYKCSSGGKFIGYLQRFSPKGLKAATAAVGKPDTDPILGQTLQEETEYSLPLKGEKGWVKSISPAAQEIMQVHCPGGGSDLPEPVAP